MTFFDLQKGQHLRDEGMQAVASFPFDEPVARVRNIDIMLAKRHGETNADEVHQYLAERLPDVLRGLQPNAWGSVFRSHKLKFSGRIMESSKVTRHSGAIRIWLYNPNGSN